jgi:hypothetical protein
MRSARSRGNRVPGSSRSLHGSVIDANITVNWFGPELTY